MPQPVTGVRYWCLAVFSLAGGCAVYDYDLGMTSSGGAVSPVDFGPPFAAPELVASLSDPVEHDDDPTLTGDLLEIYFSSRRQGGLGVGDIWRSTRPSVGDTWATPTAVSELNTELDETSVALAPDGLALWLSSERPGGPGGTDVWVTRRADRQAAWGGLVLVAAVSTPGDEIVRGLTPSGDLLLSRRDDVDETPFDMYVASRQVDDTFAAPVPIAELNTAGNEADPFLAADDRVLYFTAADGGEDNLFVAARSAPDAPFVRVRALDELNSAAADRDPWVSSDQRLIFFASRRQNDQLDIYSAAR